MKLASYLKKELIYTYKMIPKLLEKRKAILLRKRGMSINKIAKELSVADSSVSVWVRHIKLTDKQKQKLKSNGNVKKGSNVWMKQRKDIRIKFQNNGFSMSKKKDWRHAFGCALYWAEGAKNRTSVEICNTDITLLKFFLSFLRDYYHVPDNKVSVYIHCYPISRKEIEDIKNYWCKELTLPKSCLRKAYIKIVKTENRKYPNGICRISVHDVSIAQQIFGAIQGYIGGKLKYRWID